MGVPLCLRKYYDREEHKFDPRLWWGHADAHAEFRRVRQSRTMSAANNETLTELRRNVIAAALMLLVVIAGTWIVMWVWT
jgi:hypothetical protein